jgi:hypothetical protein
MKIKRLIEVSESALNYNGELITSSERYSTKHADEIKVEIDHLFDNRKDVQPLLDKLFPDQIPISSVFFEKLSLINKIIGTNEISYRLIGLLWIEAFNRNSEDHNIKLLEIFSELDNIDFWVILRVFPVFLSEYEVTPKFMQQWGLSIYERVKNDLMSGPFYRGLENYGLNFPLSAYNIVYHYVALSHLSDSQISFVSILLGALRASNKKNRLVLAKLEELDRFLNHSRKIALRMCFYRSLAVSFSYDALTIEQLNNHLNDMLSGSNEEIENSYALTLNCFLKKKDDLEYLQYYLEWLKKNVPQNVNSYARYYVIESLWRIIENESEYQGVVNSTELDELILKTQPMGLDENASWERLQYYLVARLKKDDDSLYDLLYNLLVLYSSTLSDLFSSDRLNYFISELSKRDLSIFISKMLLDRRDARMAALKLYQEIGALRISVDVLEKATDIQLYIILLEIIRQPMLGEDTSRFFLEIEPIFSKRESDIKNLFENEMLRQAINYPGVCLDKWKKQDNSSDLIKRIIRSADDYFIQKKSLIKLPALNFIFPEFIEALEKGRRVYSNKVAKGAKEKSVIARLVKNIQIIYGDKWSVYTRGHISAPSGFKKFEHSIEYPRLEVIDPEGMALDRIRAAKLINELENEL